MAVSANFDTTSVDIASVAIGIVARKLMRSGCLLVLLNVTEFPRQRLQESCAASCCLARMKDVGSWLLMCASVPLQLLLVRWEKAQPNPTADLDSSATYL
jgi:hypothetical protein